MSTGRAILHLSAAALLFLGLGGASASATQHKTHHTPPPPTSRDVEPDTTATIAARPAARPPNDAAAAVTKPDDEPLPAPYHLPTASRARMRDCGLKWQAMKMSGEAGDDIWRDFATRCLAAANGPSEAR